MLAIETKETLKKLDNLPTLPNIATALLQMATREGIQVEEVTDLIEADPATSARLLRIVNSAYRGMSGKVSSVNRAVVMLGVNGVRNALLSMQVFSIFGQADREENAELFELWKHCLAVACAAELVAENTGGILPEDAFTAGLLHDVGKIALHCVAPDDYRKVLEIVEKEGVHISDAEERVFSVSHCTAGRFLAEKWELPRPLTLAIYQHHDFAQLEDVENATMTTCAIVSVADDLVRRQRIGFSGTPESREPIADVCGRIGLDERNVQDILAHLIERVSVKSAILDFDLPESELYLECVEKANGALGALNEELQEARFTLERSERRLEAVRDLHASLGSSFDYGDVLAGIADKVYQHLLPRKVIAYCVDEKGYSMIGSVKDGTAAAKPFFISLLKGAANDVGGIGPDKDALGHLVSELGNRLEAHTGAGDLVAGRLAFFPISVGRGQRAGVLLETKGPRGLDMDELRFFSEAAGLALERALLEERLRGESEKLLDSNRRSKTFYEELMSSRKLAAIGRMAAGAAHEINNPLAIVSGRIQLLLKLESDQAKKRHLEMIRTQCDRMGHTIADILTFARPEKPNLEPTGVVNVIEQAITLVEEDARSKGVRIVRQMKSDLPRIAADAAKLEQAFRNILANGIDASETGAEMTIGANVGEKGKFLAVTFADNGSGMDDETLGRIFEPFFTTKEGGGTGLGLAICHSIIQTHGGKVRVRSAPGQGTTFNVLLPVAKA